MVGCDVHRQNGFQHLLTSFKDFLFICDIPQINLKIQKKWYFLIDWSDLATGCRIYLLKKTDIWKHYSFFFVYSLIQQFLALELLTTQKSIHDAYIYMFHHKWQNIWKGESQPATANKYRNTDEKPSFVVKFHIKLIYIEIIEVDFHRLIWFFTLLLKKNFFT